ncbi:MAG: hypothetical protein NXI31_26115 [bacterium]|nr:hypothetical protein [bacterium]
MNTPTCKLFSALGIVAWLPLAGCAKGGDEDRPQSEIRLTASHHMFGFRSQAGFVGIPVDPALVVTNRGLINLFDDSSYTITSSSGTSGAETYALAESGELTLFVTGTGRDPTVVFLGGYSRAGNNLATSDMFFTDRVSTAGSPSLGLFLATRVFTATPDFDADGWHLGSMHVVFDGAVQSPDSVARAAWGDLTVSGGTGGSLGAITGPGQQGSSSLSFTGSSIQAIEQSGTFDGSCNLTLDYTLLNQPTDSRTFLAGAGPNIVFGLDEDVADGEAGLAVMVRKFSTTEPADRTVVPGTFFVGGYTTFINPVDPGADAFVGVVTLGSPSGASSGAFRLEGQGSQGTDFSYTGSYTVDSDGGLTITINGTNEVWNGAIDREYKTLMIVDDFQETRSNGQIELNLMVGVREKTG